MANACRHVRHKFLIHLVKCTTCRFMQNKDYDLPILDYLLSNVMLIILK